MKDMQTPLFIIQVVFNYFRVSVFYQMTKTHKHEIVLARQVSMYFMRQYTGLSLEGIGRYFSRDHATVLHAFRTVNNLRDTDRHFRDDLIQICERINSRYDVNEMIYAHYDTDRV